MRREAQVVQGLARLASSLVGEVVAARRRGLPELRLALAIAVLSETGHPATDEILVKVGMLDHPPAVWVSALARALRWRRAESSAVLSWIGGAPASLVMGIQSSPGRQSEALLGRVTAIATKNEAAAPCCADVG